MFKDSMMRSILVLVAVVVGLATAFPQTQTKEDRLRYLLTTPDVPNRNSALEELILGIIESLREVILTGTDTIPVLDPFVLEHLHIDDSLLPLPGAHVTLNDVTVTNLSTYVVDSLSLSLSSLLLQRYRLQMDGNIPVLNVDTRNYDLSVNAFGLHVFGNGEAKLQVIRPRIRVNTLVGLRLSGGIFLNIIEFDLAFSIEDFRPQITGLFNDQGISDFVALFLQNLVMELLEFYEVEINQFLSETIHEVANEFLSDFNLADILG